MRRTTLSFQFKEGWKPLYSAETIQPLGHYDNTSRDVCLPAAAHFRASDTGTTINVGIGTVISPRTTVVSIGLIYSMTIAS